MISVVVPLYNEAESIKKLYDKLTSVLENEKAYELIFVDDGSTDASLNLLKELAAEDQKIKVISLRSNFGKSAALGTGFREVSGDIVITMDADLQDDPKEIPRFLAKLDEGYDLVSGWKRVRLDPISKTLPSRFFNWVTSSLSGIQIHDFNCGFKAYRREVVSSIKVYGELHRYLPVLAHSQGFKVTEIDVHHHRREFGTSKYGMERLLHGFLDLLTVLYLTKFNKRPLHLFGSVGTLLGLAGFGICSYITILRLTYGSILERKPLLILGILLIIVGVQFISMGLIGEMMAFHHQKDIDYPVREKIHL